MRNAAGLEQGVVTAFFAVLLAGSMTLLLTLLGALGLLVANERLQVAVDLAALAAADTHRGLVSGFGCENALSILKTVDAVLTTCRIVGDGVMVSGQFRLPLFTLEARATAGGF